MTTMSVSQAREGLPGLLDLVEGGDEVVITRHGRAVAVVLRPDAVRSRRQTSAVEAADNLRSRLEHARHLELTHSHSVTASEAEQLVDRVRADREAR